VNEVNRVGKIEESDPLNPDEIYDGNPDLESNVTNELIKEEEEEEDIIELDHINPDDFVGEKLKCHLCKFSHHLRKKLNRHIRKKHGNSEKKLECSLCKKFSTDKMYNFKLHAKSCKGNIMRAKKEAMSRKFKEENKAFLKIGAAKRLAKLEKKPKVKVIHVGPNGIPANIKSIIAKLK